MNTLCKSLALSAFTALLPFAGLHSAETVSTPFVPAAADSSETQSASNDSKKEIDAKWAKAHEIHEIAMDQIGVELEKELEKLKTSIALLRDANNTTEQQAKLDEAAKEILKTAEKGMEARTTYGKTKAALEGYKTLEKALLEAEDAVGNTYADDIRKSRARIERLNGQMDTLLGMNHFIEEREKFGANQEAAEEAAKQAAAKQAAEEAAKQAAAKQADEEAAKQAAAKQAAEHAEAVRQSVANAEAAHKAMMERDAALRAAQAKALADSMAASQRAAEERQRAMQEDLRRRQAEIDRQRQIFQRSLMNNGGRPPLSPPAPSGPAPGLRPFQ